MGMVKKPSFIQSPQALTPHRRHHSGCGITSAVRQALGGFVDFYKRCPSLYTSLFTGASSIDAPSAAMLLIFTRGRAHGFDDPKNRCGIQLAQAHGQPAFIDFAARRK